MDIIEVELLPGTEVMRDHDGEHMERGRGAHAVVLIPQPSASPQDPLNWSLRWKYLVIITQSLYTFVTVMSALSLAPMFPLLAAEWDLNSTQLSLLTGSCVLALGYANFIIVPCSNLFGRRATSITFSIMVIGTTIWEALAKSHQSFLIARVFNGIATAVSESLMVQVVADTFFVHERGRYMGLYFTSYFMGLFLGPVIAGNIGGRYGWRTFFYLAIGLATFNTITLLLGAPETRWNRKSKRPAIAHFSISGDSDTQMEAVSARIPPSHASHSEAAEDLTDSKHEAAHIEQLQDPEFAAFTAVHGAGRPDKAQWGLWQKPAADWRSTLFKDIISPWSKFANPIIFWAGLNVAGPANLLLLWNLTESSFLGAPPYNFTTGQVGYVNFAFAVGGLVGLFTAGPLSDYLAQRATKRNNGIREAEFRLPAMIPFGMLTAVGVVVGGLGYDRLWPWPVVVAIGYGFTGLCVTSIPTIAVAYAVDSYTSISGDIMVVATVMKNTCGFVMSYWVDPLEARKGMIVPAMVEFALTVGPILLGIPMYYLGKRLRRFTRHSAWHD